MRADPPHPTPREKVDLSSAEGLCIHTKDEGNPGFLCTKKIHFHCCFFSKESTSHNGDVPP